ncbi:MAG: cation transporter [Prevotella sp.]|nr:cation transporter [Prevotella sp.]
MTQTEQNPQKRFNSVYRFTLKSALANLLLLAFKFVAGIFGYSHAMIADAVHSTADFVQDVMAVLYLRMGNKEKDDRHDYGYGRYATVATVFVSILLFAAGIYLVVKAAVIVTNFFANDGTQLERPGIIALIAALVSIAVKYVMAYLASLKAHVLDSRFISVNALRYRMDAVSSIGTAIAILFAVLLSSKWRVMDSIAALIVALFILRTAYRMFRHALDELLDKSLSEETETEIATLARKVDEVDDVIRVLTRRVGGKVAIELVIRMKGNLSLNQVHRRVVQIEDLLEQRFGETAHMAIHVEPTPDVQNVAD